MPRHLLALLALLAILPSTARSQSRLFTFDGAAPANAFGRSVAAAGDVNADGIPDVIVGEPEHDGNGAESGQARVFSGADGTVLWTFQGAAANDRLGHSVAGAGDVNADGHADLIVGAIGDASSGFMRGAAYVFSGADGMQLHVFHGTQPLGFFGFCVAGAGDFDVDGHDDLIVAGPILAGPGNGRVFSGADGSVLFQFLTQGFGELCAGAGDIDGDGFADIVVGSPLDATGGANAGSVRVVSGRTGMDLHRFDGVAGDELGVAVAGAGDVNGDGFDDVIAGARQLLNGGTGLATVWSGADGTVLGTFAGATAGEGFATSVGGAGDVDGDGLDDVIVGAWSADANGADSGCARVYSVLAATVLLTLAGESAGDELGTSVAGAGDVDDDGFADVIVGAPRDDDNGTDAGRAFVEDAGFTGTPGRERIHGVACPGSTGVPRIDHRGDARLGASLQVRLRGALPSTLVVMFVGASVVAPLDPLGLTGCTGYVDPGGIAVWSATDTDGLVAFPVNLPASATYLLGLRFDFQWVVFDQGVNPAGLVVSNALAATFGS